MSSETTAPFGMSRVLRDLLRRDVALEISHQRLADSLSAVESETETLQKTRPPFLFLHSKATRTNFNNQMLNAGESMTALVRGLEKIERMQPLLLAWVEDELENHLRATNPQYVAGLATHRFPEDWERLGRRFGARLQRFIEFLQNLRGELSGLPPGSVVSSDPAVSALLDRTAKVGAAVDAEVTFLNHLADVQRRTVELNADTLKRQAPLSCEANVMRLRAFAAGQAAKAIGEITANATTQAQQIRGAITSEGALAITGEERGVRGFVLPHWTALRKTVRLDLDPEAIEQLVADTEKLLDGHV